MQQPREERRMKREKKRYFLAKMIKKSPEGTPILFTFHFSLFTQGGVANICNTPLSFAYDAGLMTIFSPVKVSKLYKIRTMSMSCSRM